MVVISTFNHEKNKHLFDTNYISSLTVAQLKILYKWTKGVPAPSVYNKPQLLIEQTAIITNNTIDDIKFVGIQKMKMNLKN